MLSETNKYSVMPFSKRERQGAIKEAILSKKIGSQEELKAELSQAGIVISQATLSRDLQEMGVVKSHGGSVSYYILPEGRLGMDNADSGVLDIELCGNIAVLKTLPGHASMFALMIDRKQIPEIAGTIAGDDTVFMVLRNGASVESCRRAILSAVPGFRKQ